MFKIAAANKDCYIRLVYLWIDFKNKNLYVMASAPAALASLIRIFLGFIAQPMMSDLQLSY
jgi:hypothetical protein